MLVSQSSKKAVKLNKNIFVMGTGNIYRSIIGEALINDDFNRISLYSADRKPSRQINVKKVLL